MHVQNSSTNGRGSERSERQVPGQGRRFTRSRRVWRQLGHANLVDGMSRERAAREAGMDRQTLGDWVIRFNAEGYRRLRDRPRSGRPPWLHDGQLATPRRVLAVP